MSEDIEKLHKEIEQLKVQLQITKIKEVEKEKTINRLIQEKTNFKEKLQNDLLREKELQTQIQTWEKIIDEMAHSINSDVYVAVSYLSQISSNPLANTALSHTKQIRDLINLIMLYLKRKEVSFSGELYKISIEEYINQQIQTIKNSLSTLRLSVEEHEEALKKIDVPVSIQGNTDILVAKELKDAISLILKDLLRNAFKNTPEENPEIEVRIIGEENVVKLFITNNKTISKEFSDWFNGKSDEEPQISKSLKVGLRVILKWTKKLSIDAKLIPDKENDLTTAELIFPRKIRYEK